MEYYTDFKFKTKLTEKQENELNLISCYCYNCSKNDLIKWNDFNKDMIEFSKLYPNEKFEIIEKRENHLNSWNKVFKNGKIIINKTIL